MRFVALDWLVIAASIVVSFLPAIFFARRASRSTAEFFTSAYPEALPPMVELATHIQDALGEVHDLDVFGDTLLADVERVAQDPARAAEAAGIARLIRRSREQRDAALARFRTLWEALPKPGKLSRQVAASGGAPGNGIGGHTYDG